MQVELILGGEHITHSIPDWLLYSEEDQKAICYRLAKNDPNNVIGFRPLNYINLNTFF